MTTRRAQVVALVAAVVVLLGSMAAMAAWSADRDDDADFPARVGLVGHRWAWDDDGDRPWGGSMMGGRWGGSMMGGPWAGGPMMGWGGEVETIPGSGPVDEQGARDAAQTWVDEYAEGADLGDAETMPMGYWFRASEGDTVVAVIMVSDDTGTVVGHLLDARAPATD
ncbi:hypothetical protein [Nocardioides sp.]|uniref:hypothetical protein n=1 Tax=Nocardioides sp. TaxID=35761 RepID=UPI002ED98BA2